jgi:hypothetical protein
LVLPKRDSWQTWLNRLVEVKIEGRVPQSQGLSLELYYQIRKKSRASYLRVLHKGFFRSNSLISKQPGSQLQQMNLVITSSTKHNQKWNTSQEEELYMHGGMDVMEA